MTVIENRASFFARFEPIWPQSDLLDLEHAYILAKQGHGWQKRKETDDKGKPVRYFEHLRRVALIIFDEVRCADPAVIKAGLLHDSLEDTRYLTPALIEHCFGPEVLQIVKQVSKVPKEGYLHRLENYGCWKALLLKGADRLDNLRSLTAGSVEFQKRQITETREKYLPIFDKMADTAPAEYAEGAKKLRDDIRSWVEMFTYVFMDMEVAPAPKPDDA